MNHTRLGVNPVSYYTTEVISRRGEAKLSSIIEFQNLIEVHFME
jgi:hypothetical protein